MAITSQAKIVAPLINRALHAIVTADQTPLSPLSEMTDGRRGLSTLFDETTVNLDFDLGPYSPWNINFVAVFVLGLSVAGTVTFQSRASTGDGWTTQQLVNLFDPLTSDGADGFGADARGADEYASPDVRRYPANPPYYALLATAVNHRYWRIVITQDIGVFGVSIPIFANLWEVPTGHGLTREVRRTILDDSVKNRSLSGAQAINPSVQRVQLTFEFASFLPSEAWQTLAFWFEEHGTRDAYFVIPYSPASAVNLSNSTDATGYQMLRTMLYGTFTDIPDIEILAGQDSTVDVVGFTVEESL